jgi:arylsulfatase A-like enzyme
VGRPNILIFMPDQQRADCLGCYGNPYVQTPNIDQLAARGMRFENAYTNHPVCGPSRINLMTGWYPHTHGHRTLTNLLKLEDPNLLRYLKQAGYNVAFAGARGDVFAPGVTEASTNFCGWTTRPRKMSMGPQYPEGSALYDVFYHGKRHSDDSWLDFDEAAIQTALDWIGQGPKEPWCLWIPLIFPHLPFEVEDPWYDMYKGQEVQTRFAGFGTGKPAFHQAIREKLGTDRLSESEWQDVQRVYYGMISRVDSQLGRVMKALNETNQIESTLTLYFTDHGEYAGDFGLVEKWPSGMDRCLLQNPLIVAGPGVQSGTVASTYTEMVDILPTLLEVAETEASHTHFGKSLVPVLTNVNETIRDTAFSEGGFATSELDLLEQASGEYAKKAQLQHEKPELVGKAICMRNDAYTYVYRLYEDDELYDRAADPDETCNLVGQSTVESVEQEMKSQVVEWLFGTADVIPWVPDPRFPGIPHGHHSPVD